MKFHVLHDIKNIPGPSSQGDQGLGDISLLSHNYTNAEIITVVSSVEQGKAMRGNTRGIDSDMTGKEGFSE